MSGSGTSREVQHGGRHYLDMKIQPIEYAEANGLSAAEFSVVKYISRHRSKGGAEDMKKAMHFCQILLRLVYGIETDVKYIPVLTANSPIDRRKPRKKIRSPRSLSTV